MNKTSALNIQWIFIVVLFFLLLPPWSSPSSAACTPAPSGLVSWWNFQSNGTDLIGSNSVYIEGYPWDMGKAGYALGNDGAAARMQTTSYDFPVANADRSMAMWVKLPNYQTQDAFFAGYGAAGEGYEGQWYALGSYSYYDNVNANRLFFSSYGETVIGPVLEPGVWHHVAVTNTGNTVKLYLNGGQVAENTLSLATAADSQFKVGYYSDLLKMVGDIDEIQVFDRALTPAEISDIYASDSSGLCYHLDITGTLADGTKGIYYGQQLPMNSSYWYLSTTYTITSGSLPPGLMISPYGTFSGVPTAEGTYSFTASIVDGLSGSGSASYTITINPAPPVSPQLASATWHSIGPYISEARALALDPFNSQILYAGTKNGLYKSINGGASWNNSSNGITNLYVRAVVIDTASSSTLYAGTDDGVYKSTDSGTSWTRLANGIPYSEGVQSLAIDPNNSQIIYAGGSDSGIYRSGNGGSSWTLINNGADLWNIKSIVVNPANSSIIYVSQPYGLGLYISQNGGTSWTHSDGTPDDIKQVVLDPTNSAVLFAASLSAGIFVSTDGGSTWQMRNNGLGSAPSIYSIAIHPASPLILYAGSQTDLTNTAQLYRSIDGGATWTISASSPSTVRLVMFDPLFPTVVYAGYDDNGFIKSINGGTSWAPINNGMANSQINSLVVDHTNSKTVYITTMTSLHKSTNGGQTWSAPLHDGWQVVLDPDAATTLYLTAGDGIYKSINGGSTWLLLPGSPVNGSLHIAPSNGQTLYFSTNNGIYRTTDGGNNWTGPLASQKFFVHAIDPLNSLTVYAGNYDNAPYLYKSTNGGDSWTLIDTAGSPTIIDPNDTQVMYGRGYRFVYKSVDGGLTWEQTGNGLPDLPVTSLAFDPHDSNVIYAGTEGNGVFASINGGDSWSQFNNGLPATSNVYYIAVDPADSRIVYAGTEISGVYKTSASTTPAIDAPVAAYFNEGQAGSFQVITSGWPTPALSVSGTIPDGLKFNSATGIVSGIPEIGTVSTDPYILMFTADNGQPPSAARAVAVYVLDTSNLVITVTAPTQGATVDLPLTTISGTASNGEAVEIQVTDGSLYLQPNGSFTTSPVWLPADRSGADWTVTVNPATAWIEGLHYTIIARVVGNSIKTVTSSFFISPSAQKNVSILSASFIKSSIRTGDSATVGGRLEGLDSAGLSGKKIDFIITPPATATVPLPVPTIVTVTTTNAAAPLDNFSSGPLTNFSIPGIYTVEVRFAGDSEQQAASLHLSLPVIAHSGYAVIVVGKSNIDNSLLPAHKATAQTIKNTLINKRGFLPGNILSVISTDSAAKLKTDISSALATIKSKYTITPAPVYLIMIDHGSPDPGGGFVLGSQTLLPSELDAMLSTFESGVDPAVLAAHKRFLIMGTCYSGLFQSVSASGRVVITSAAATEQSLAGSVSYSGNTPALSGGDYFMDTLFAFLGRGDSFKNAFSQARNAVALRDPRKVPLGLHSGEVDALAQHPLLNDDGNSTGSYRLDGSTDGVASASLYLGEGVRVPAGGNPTDITAVLPTTILGTSTSNQTLWMQVNDSSRVDRAWVEIRTPGTTASSGGTGQVIPGGLATMPLIYDGQKWVGDYTQFTDPGRYDVYYYARDNQTGDTSPMAHTVIYKKKPGNSAPGSFTLSAPANASQVKLPFPLTWKESTDTDGKTYSLVVATDANFSSIVYREDDIPVGATILPESALRDPANPGFYYCQNNNASCWWKVRAIDAFGEETWSDSRSFNVLMSNTLFVMIKAFVTAGGLPVSDATCSVSSGDSVSSLPTGLCLMTTSSLPVTASFTAAGYTSKTNIAVPDPIDNVSLMSVPLNPTVTTHTLTLTIDGSGSGLVSCSKGAESVLCNGTFSASDSISLLATNDWKTLPVSWGGSCSGTLTSVCSLLMDSDRSVLATFNPNYQARIVLPPYSSGSLQAALDSAANGATVEAMDYDFLEPILFDRSGFEVTIDGGRGYPGYTLPATGYSTVQGSFRIKQGTIKVKGPMAVR